MSEKLPLSAMAALVDTWTGSKFSPQARAIEANRSDPLKYALALEKVKQQRLDREERKSRQAKLNEWKEKEYKLRKDTIKLNQDEIKAKAAKLKQQIDSDKVVAANIDISLPELQDKVKSGDMSLKQANELLKLQSKVAKVNKDTEKNKAAATQKLKQLSAKNAAELGTLEKAIAPLKNINNLWEENIHKQRQKYPPITRDVPLLGRAASSFFAGLPMVFQTPEAMYKDRADMEGMKLAVDAQGKQLNEMELRLFLKQMPGANETRAFKDLKLKHLTAMAANRYIGKLKAYVLAGYDVRKFIENMPSQYVPYLSKNDKGVFGFNKEAYSKIKNKFIDYSKKSANKHDKEGAQAVLDTVDSVRSYLHRGMDEIATPQNETLSGSEKRKLNRNDNIDD